MTTLLSSPLFYLTMLLVGLGLVLAFGRFLLGPTALDRVVAADTLNVAVTALLVLLALILHNPLYLDIALIYAVLAFVGTVAIGRSLEKPSKTASEDKP